MLSAINSSRPVLSMKKALPGRIRSSMTALKCLGPMRRKQPDQQVSTRGRQRAHPLLPLGSDEGVLTPHHSTTFALRLARLAPDSFGSAHPSAGVVQLGRLRRFEKQSQRNCVGTYGRLSSRSIRRVSSERHRRIFDGLRDRLLNWKWRRATEKIRSPHLLPNRYKTQGVSLPKKGQMNFTTISAHQKEKSPAIAGLSDNTLHK